jgi:hypothetical protein
LIKQLIHLSLDVVLLHAVDKTAAYLGCKQFFGATPMAKLSFTRFVWEVCWTGPGFALQGWVHKVTLPWAISHHNKKKKRKRKLIMNLYICHHFKSPCIC